MIFICIVVKVVEGGKKEREIFFIMTLNLVNDGLIIVCIIKML